MPDQIGVVFCIYAVFKVKQGILGAIGVREDCYSFPKGRLLVHSVKLFFGMLVT